MLNFNDGVIPYKGSDLYIREIGSERREKTLKLHPLVVIPGGPGFSHDYLETIEAVAQTERRVLLFDPLGTGQSSKKAGPFSTVDLVDQVNALLKAIGVKEYHLYAHGSGVAAALEKLKQVRQKAGGEKILSLTCASPFEKGKDLISSFSEKSWKENPEAKKQLLNNRKVTPICVEESLKTSSSLQYTETFLNLENWDCSPFMEYVTCPVTITYGRNDLVPESSVLGFKSQITASTPVQTKCFEKSGHLAHLDEKEEYLQFLQDFLNKVDDDIDSKGNKNKKSK